MRCISPMVYESTAKSVHWYQSYHWYQWMTGIPMHSYLIHLENILSPPNEMYFTNGVSIDCQVSPLVPIIPLVPMDDQNPPVLQSYLIHLENILSPLNEMHFTNGVLTDRQASPLDSVCGQSFRKICSTPHNLQILETAVFCCAYNVCFIHPLLIQSKLSLQPLS